MTPYQRRAVQGFNLKRGISTNNSLVNIPSTEVQQLLCTDNLFIKDYLAIHIAPRGTSEKVPLIIMSSISYILFAATAIQL